MSTPKLIHGYEVVIGFETHTQLSTTGSFRLRHQDRAVVIRATSYTSSDVGTASVSVDVDGATVFSETRRDPVDE